MHEKVMTMTRPIELDSYNAAIEQLRYSEYPMCRDKVYLDHAGTTLYPVSLIVQSSADLIKNLYGNPHSASDPSKLTSAKVTRVRQRLLDFLGADPGEFDVVFTANATASIKLVMDCFQDLAASGDDQQGGGNNDHWSGNFWYGYHRDAHTSLVGVREATNGCHACFEDDGQVEAWLDGVYIPYGLGSHGRIDTGKLALFAYPGQSNMTGRRLPLNWSRRARRSELGLSTFTLLDAAALATTSELSAVFQSQDSAPDFTALSLYKIFGYPDLGALILRKRSAHILSWRKYFGGGTIDMATVLGRSQNVWHQIKRPETSRTTPVDHTNGDGHQLDEPADHDPLELHDQLEDGTLPFHSIVALDSAFDIHTELFTSMSHISAHTQSLTLHAHKCLLTLHHSTGHPLVRMMNDPSAIYGDPQTQGATLAFNLFTPTGALIPYLDVDAASNARGIYVRSGGLCNPGGVETHCDVRPWEMRRAWSAGHRCGNGRGEGGDDGRGKALGVVRVSFGAMSTRADVDAFVAFLGEVYLDAPGCGRARGDGSPAVPVDGSLPNPAPPMGGRAPLRWIERLALREKSRGRGSGIGVRGSRSGIRRSLVWRVESGESGH